MGLVIWLQALLFLEFNYMRIPQSFCQQAFECNSENDTIKIIGCYGNCTTIINEHYKTNCSFFFNLVHIFLKWMNKVGWCNRAFNGCPWKLETSRKKNNNSKCNRFAPPRVWRNHQYLIMLYVVLRTQSAIVAFLAPNGKAKVLFLFDCHRKGFNVFIIFPNRFFK